MNSLKRRNFLMELRDSILAQIQENYLESLFKEVEAREKILRKKSDKSKKY